MLKKSQAEEGENEEGELASSKQHVALPGFFLMSQRSLRGYNCCTRSTARSCLQAWWRKTSFQQMCKAHAALHLNVTLQAHSVVCVACGRYLTTCRCGAWPPAKDEAPWLFRRWGELDKAA